MKLDNKSILIIILLGISIIFGGMWFFKGSDTKDELKELKKANKAIQLERDSLSNRNRKLESVFNEYQAIIVMSESRSNAIGKELSKVKSDLTIANNKVSKSQKELEITKNKINELKANPIKRVDDDLINSLKEKLK